MENSITDFERQEKEEMRGITFMPLSSLLSMPYSEGIAVESMATGLAVK